VDQSIKTTRATIFHNVPVGGAPVPYRNPRTNQTSWSSSLCMSHVDPRVAGCQALGLTGGAVRSGHMKLLTTYPGKHVTQDSSPAGIGQYTPGGRYPNGTAVFSPATNDTIPAVFVVNETLGVFLFNISDDPTETVNLAESEPKMLAAMLKLYTEYSASAVTPLYARWGFRDPMQGNTEPRPNEARCAGSYHGSDYCHYGREFECFVGGLALAAGPIGGEPTATDETQCMAACAAHPNCGWWVLRSSVAGAGSASEPDGAARFPSVAPVQGGAGAAASLGCSFYGTDAPSKGYDRTCLTCSLGPASCGFGGAPLFPKPLQPPPAPPPSPAPPAPGPAPYRCKSDSTSCFVAEHGLSNGECTGCKPNVVTAADAASCQRACQAEAANGCEWWVFRPPALQCHLKSARGTEWAGSATFGPRCCP
jgi:hypothetical protein